MRKLRNQIHQKNEIGIHLLSLHAFGFSDKWNHVSVGSYDVPLFDKFPGITYKRFIRQHIFRSSFTYRTISSFHEKPPKFWGNEGNYKESILKFGYEKDLNKRKLTPYFALDLALIYIDYKGFYKGDGPGYSSYKINGKGIGISPAFGLKYKLSQNLSLNAESCFDIPYFHFHINESTSRYPYEMNTYNWHSQFNPLQKLSLNIKF